MGVGRRRGKDRYMRQSGKDDKNISSLSMVKVSKDL
jgi:hypothetical protein